MTDDIRPNKIEVSMEIFGQSHDVPAENAMIKVNGKHVNPPMSVSDLGEVMLDLIRDLITASLHMEQRKPFADEEFRQVLATTLSKATYVLVSAGYGSPGVTQDDMFEIFERHQKKGE